MTTGTPSLGLRSPIVERKYDLFMKVANVSMDIVLSGISNPWNPMKKG